MLSTYNLYFHNLPSLESRCSAAGIPLSPFLSATTSHVVVLNRNKLCPRLQATVTSLGVKVVSAAAVAKWLADCGNRLSPPPPQKKTSPPKAVVQVTERQELVITDMELLYKPISMKSTAIPFDADVVSTGSPWAAPTRTRTPTNTRTPPTATSTRVPSTTRVQLLTTSRKIFCENCRVSVKDLDLHTSTLQHRRYAKKEENFAELDAVIGDLTLGNLLMSLGGENNSSKRRRFQ